MEYQEASSEVERILRADLGALSHGEGASVRPPAALRSWKISVRDREALSDHGLPSVPSVDMLMRVGAHFQSSGEPEFSSVDWRGYVIGRCGEVKIVVNDRSGSVLAVPEVSDIPPVLAPLHPDGIQDELINSKVIAFVDFCWRWYWLSPVLLDQRDRADRAEMDAWEAARKSGNKGSEVDFHVPYRELCAKVRANFCGKERLMVDNPSSMWSVMIDGFE
ncbi:SUKH-4 family immunity protein [Streptomyces sp. NPDC002742]|uniref:SUKH-4 family immunity protein n=1 Tax=Streptomyces sp. NPDC002742 TaxID=3364663 RepID=UPI0036A851F2